MRTHHTLSAVLALLLAITFGRCEPPAEKPPALTAEDKKYLDGLMKDFLFDLKGAERVTIKIVVLNVWSSAEDQTREGWLVASKDGKPGRVYFTDGASVPTPAEKEMKKVDFKSRVPGPLRRAAPGERRQGRPGGRQGVSPDARDGGRGAGGRRPRRGRLALPAGGGEPGRASPRRRPQRGGRPPGPTARRAGLVGLRRDGPRLHGPRRRGGPGPRRAPAAPLPRGGQGGGLPPEPPG